MVFYFSGTGNSLQAAQAMLSPGEKRTVEFSEAQVIDPAKLSVSSLR